MKILPAILLVKIPWNTGTEAFLQSDIPYPVNDSRTPDPDLESLDPEKAFIFWSITKIGFIQKLRNTKLLNIIIL